MEKKIKQDSMKVLKMVYTLIMLIDVIGLQVFANQLIGTFAVSKETSNLCILVIRIITLVYL